jgi:hypothetical protein
VGHGQTDIRLHLTSTLGVYLFIYLFLVFYFIFIIYLFIYICLSIYLSIYLSICLSVCLSACLPACLPVCLSVYLSICLSVCLSSYLFIAGSQIFAAVIILLTVKKYFFVFPVKMRHREKMFHLKITYIYKVYVSRYIQMPMQRTILDKISCFTFSIPLTW